MIPVCVQYQQMTAGSTLSTFHLHIPKLFLNVQVLNAFVMFLDWLTVTVSAADLAKELSSLVTIQPDTVSVKKEQNADTYNFTVTFKSDRGKA